MMAVLRSLDGSVAGISWLCQQHTLLISHVLATHKLCVVKYQHNTPQQSTRNHNPQPCCFDGALLQPLFPSCHCCCERIAAALTGWASHRRAAKQQWQNSNSSSSTPSPSPLPSSLPLLSSWDYVMPPICLHPRTAPSFASSTFAHDCLTITPPLALTHVRPCCRQRIAIATANDSRHHRCKCHHRHRHRHRHRVIVIVDHGGEDTIPATIIGCCQCHQ